MIQLLYLPLYLQEMFLFDANIVVWPAVTINIALQHMLRIMQITQIG